MVVPKTFRTFVIAKGERYPPEQLKQRILIKQTNTTMITYKHYNNYNDFAEAHNEDWLESYLYFTKPNASHDAEGINEAMPADEQEELREAIESKGLEQALEDIFGSLTCVQIDGGHTGREEDTIWYYIN